MDIVLVFPGFTPGFLQHITEEEDVREQDEQGRKHTLSYTHISHIRGSLQNKHRTLSCEAFVQLLTM